jgi:hypothetical protein
MGNGESVEAAKLAEISDVGVPLALLVVIGHTPVFFELFCLLAQLLRPSPVPNCLSHRFLCPHVPMCHPLTPHVPICHPLTRLLIHHRVSVCVYLLSRMRSLRSWLSRSFKQAFKTGDFPEDPDFNWSDSPPPSRKKKGDPNDPDAEARPTHTEVALEHVKESAAEVARVAGLKYVIWMCTAALCFLLFLLSGFLHVRVSLSLSLDLSLDLSLSTSLSLPCFFLSTYGCTLSSCVFYVCTSVSRCLFYVCVRVCRCECACMP